MSETFRHVLKIYTYDYIKMCFTPRPEAFKPKLYHDSETHLYENNFIFILEKNPRTSNNIFHFSNKHKNKKTIGSVCFFLHT